MTEATHALNILWGCTGHILEPRSGGELRVHHLTRELARRGHRVDVLSLVVRNHPARIGQPVPGLTVHEIHSPWLDLAAVADRLKMVPITELALWLRPMRGGLRRWIAQQQPAYDIVHFELPWFSGLYPAVSAPARVVYGSQNVESHWWAPKLASYPLGEKYCRRLRDHELRAAREANGVSVCTEADRDWFVQNGGLNPERFGLTPNGFDPERITRPDASTRQRVRAELGLGEDEKIALFIGSDQPPNRRAVEDLLKHVAPRLGEMGARLAIVGRVGARFADARGEHVLITGGVEDVLPWLQAADLGLNPVTEGSGSNIKLAEYCAAGLSVVTTRFGLRGYEALAEWLSVCEVEEFAPAMGEIIRQALDQSDGVSMVPEATMQAFSWPSVAATVEAFYRGILTRR